MAYGCRGCYQNRPQHDQSHHLGCLSYIDFDRKNMTHAMAGGPWSATVRQPSDQLI